MTILIIMTIFTIGLIFLVGAPFVHYVEQSMYTYDWTSNVECRKEILVSKKIGLLDDCLLHFTPQFTEIGRARIGRFFLVCVCRYKVNIKVEDGNEIEQILYCQEPIFSIIKRINKKYKIWVIRRKDYLSKPEYFFAVTKLDYIYLGVLLFLLVIWFYLFYLLISIS